GPVKNDTSCSQSINVGRNRYRIAITAQLRPEIIHRDKEHIRPLLAHGRRARRKPEDHKTETDPEHPDQYPGVCLIFGFLLIDVLCTGHSRRCESLSRPYSLETSSNTAPNRIRSHQILPSETNSFFRSSRISRPICSGESPA